MTYEIVGMFMLAIFGVSLVYPRAPCMAQGQVARSSPAMLLPLWAWYESLMPSTMNIRFDLLVIIGAMRLLAVVYVLRLILFWLLRDRRGQKAAPSAIDSQT